MDYRFRKFESLNKDELSLWRRLQVAHEHLESPFFRPEFSELIHRLHGGVEVCMLVDKNSPCGFFPYQRAGSGDGRPVGQLFNEAQGLIAAPNVRPAPLELMQACGLAAWDFDRVPKSQLWCQNHSQTEHRSFVADLKHGFDHYATVLRNRGTLELREAERLEQKIDREVGGIHFLANEHLDELWQCLLRWKNQHSKVTGAKNALADESTCTLFREMLKSTDSGFQGMLFGLHAGHQLVAVEAGLRSAHVYHHLWWSCDQDFARFGPAQVMRLELLRWAAANGIRKVELGRTPEDYKAALATSEQIFMAGSVTATLLANITRQISFGMQRMFTRKAAV